jgi:hypothetical protein
MAGGLSRRATPNAMLAPQIFRARLSDQRAVGWE